jgi:hypothetical protein
VVGVAAVRLEGDPSAFVPQVDVPQASTRADGLLRDEPGDPVLDEVRTQHRLERVLRAPVGMARHPHPCRPATRRARPRCPDQVLVPHERLAQGTVGDGEGFGEGQVGGAVEDRPQR